MKARYPVTPKLTLSGLVPGKLASLIMIGMLFASFIYWLAPLYTYQDL